MKENRKNPILFLSIGLSALFLLGFLLVVVFGARSYRDAVDSQYGNMDERALSAYLAASIKANDSKGAVHIEDSDYGQVLVVTDAESDWALRYYLSDGRLVEDFARDGSPLAPEDAQQIAPTEIFTLEISENGLLTVTTDEGRMLLHPRCETGAAE